MKKALILLSLMSLFVTFEAYGQTDPKIPIPIIGTNPPSEPLHRNPEIVPISCSVDLNAFCLFVTFSYDLGDVEFDEVRRLVSKAAYNPFWSKDTIQLGDSYCSSDDAFFEERVYDDYHVENDALDEARLMKTYKDAEIIYVRELLNRKLWQYKYEHDIGERLDYYYYISVRDFSEGYEVTTSATALVGQVAFYDSNVCGDAISVVTQVLYSYSDEVDFCRKVLGVE